MSDDPEFSASEDGGQEKNPSAERPPRRFDEVSPLDLLLVLSRGRGLIILWAIGLGLVGLLYAATTPSEYTASSRVVREAEGDAGGGLPSGLPSVQGLGIDLGGGGGGLTSAAYPDIATSREVRLAVARDTFYFSSTGRRTTFVDHVNEPLGPVDYVLDFTVYLPWTVKDGISDVLFGTAEPKPIETDSSETLIYPTEEEEEAIEVLGERLSASVAESGALEEGSGLMTISMTAEAPTLAARMNERVIEHLRTRVREIRTETTRENLKFIEQRFDEVEGELDAAEERLSQFLERNRSVLSGGNEPQLEFRRERLRREVRFKEQLYSQLQEQVTQTRLQLRREQPVVTIAEQPAPPPDPSAPNRTLTVALSLLLGGGVGVGGAFVRSFSQNHRDDEEYRTKTKEIRAALTPSGVVKAVRKEMGLDDDVQSGP